MLDGARLLDLSIAAVAAAAMDKLETKFETNMANGHTCIAHIHYITLHYITLHYITLHYIT